MVRYCEWYQNIYQEILVVFFYVCPGATQSCTPIRNTRNQSAVHSWLDSVNLTLPDNTPLLFRSGYN